LSRLAVPFLACAFLTVRGECSEELTPSELHAPEDAVEVLTAPAMASLEERRRTLAAHEARLAIWEKDLARLAADESYFTDLEGYVTPSALARSFVLGAFVSVGLTLLVLRTLERRGLWRTGASSRASRELAELEARVLTGLREFDGLLSRVYERLQSEATGVSRGLESRSERAAVEVSSSEPAPRRRVETPSGRPPRASSVRDEVAALTRGGVAREEIGRRLGLGHAEIDFILRTEASR
jgi:hypothetical protein